MREIIFDTETTGLDSESDRVIELGAVELINRFPTGRTFHVYINPEGRAIHAEAQAVHGITADQLADKPVFSQIIDEFLAFIEDAKLVAHNAGFDMGFINAELKRLGHLPVEQDRVIDTLALARRKHPMGPNSLDALCRRYGIDNGHRTKHGALLDSELLADVYVELAGGRQAALLLETHSAGRMTAEGETISITIRPRPVALPPRISEAEIAAHAALVARLGDKAIWAKLESQASAN